MLAERLTTEDPDLLALPRISSEQDPLQSPTLLFHAEVSECRIDLMYSSVSLLLDLRVAEHYGSPRNVGLLVAQGAHNLRWALESIASPRESKWINNIYLTTKPGWLELDLDLFMPATLQLRARRFVFYSANLRLSSEQADYGLATDDEIYARSPNWASDLQPLDYSVLDG
jgi:hypothetical protein